MVFALMKRVVLKIWAMGGNSIFSFGTLKKEGGLLLSNKEHLESCSIQHQHNSTQTRVCLVLNFQVGDPWLMWCGFMYNTSRSRWSKCLLPRDVRGSLIWPRATALRLHRARDKYTCTRYSVKIFIDRCECSLRHLNKNWVLRWQGALFIGKVSQARSYHITLLIN